MSQNNSMTNTDKSKEDLINLVSKCQQRTFAEEIDYIEELGGDKIFEQILHVDYRRGIDESEVAERQKQFGTAEVEEEPMKGFFKIWWEALDDFTLRILLVAATVSIIANMIVEKDHRSTAWIEGFAIYVAVAVCSGVAAGNDYEKEKQFRKLKEVSGSKKEVRVWRNGVLKSIPETKLVSGDVIKLSEGMDIPVDMFVLEAHDLTVNESALTGEPDAIKKKPYKECLEKRNELQGEKANAKSHDVYSPILMSGTSILTGEGKAVVLLVGESSIIGQIRQFLNQEPEVTPLQEKLEAVARDIGKFGLISGCLTLIVLIIRFLVDRAITNTWSEGSEYIVLVRYVIVAIAVIAVAIPEGLPLSVTLSLAYSVRKMMKDNNLVRKLYATETMGGANNICSDKTGTLTQNKMNLTHFWNGKIIEIDPYGRGSLSDVFPEKFQEIMRQALACNSSATLDPYVGSKTEIALLEFLQNKNEDYHVLREKYVPESAIKFPFSSQRKRMSTILENVDNDSKKRMHIKGASEIVLTSCSKFYDFEQDKIIDITEEMRKKIDDEITKMANMALRTICVAYKEITGKEDLKSVDDKNVYEIEKNDFILLGVLGIRDILREEVKDSVAKCKAAGIKVRMVTGDNKITAKAIAIECGIIDPNNQESVIMTGPEFMELTGGVVCKNCKTKDCDCPRDADAAKEKGKEPRVDTIKNKEAFDKIYRNLDVLARSRPEDKYALVTGLIERGCVVAVTGDGTNDAPALRKADVGFAMNSGTDVAKEAADIILLDDNFASIVKAAMWGRNIYDNIRRFLQFQLTVNIVAVGITLVSAAVLKDSVMSAVQLLWVNLIMDTLASLALATEPPTEKLLERKPYDRNGYIISRAMMKHIIGQAIFQFSLIMVLVFTADKWIPEFLPHEEIPDYPGEEKYYSDGVHMRSGRPYFITEMGEDYLRFESELGPSRHYTFIFNTFVFCQVFNFMNARKIHEEYNIFEGVFRNPLFCVIVAGIAGLQLIIGNLGGIPMHVSYNGMDVRQWLIAIGLASFGLIWSIILKTMARLSKLCPKAGKKRIHPFLTYSRILRLKRSRKQNVLYRRFNTSEFTKMPSFKRSQTVDVNKAPTMKKNDSIQIEKANLYKRFHTTADVRVPLLTPNQSEYNNL